MLCDECKFDSSVPSNADLAAQIGGYARKYQAPLTRMLPGDDRTTILTTRPDPDTWSALEYAVHVSEVLGFAEQRIRRLVDEERPQLVRRDFAGEADREGYADRDPDVVAAEIAGRAQSLAEYLGALDEDEWDREGVGVDGDRRTVRSTAAGTAHEGFHHLLDIGRALRAARGR